MNVLCEFLFIDFIIILANTSLFFQFRTPQFYHIINNSCCLFTHYYLSYITGIQKYRFNFNINQKNIRNERTNMSQHFYATGYGIFPVHISIPSDLIKNYLSSEPQYSIINNVYINNSEQTQYVVDMYIQYTGRNLLISNTVLYKTNEKIVCVKHNLIQNIGFA